ncbi:MAG: hypothetical protein U5L05_01415 [Rubrivivax sp.]|nr:hypothetical protein [Rubrivivax sp.]
MSSEPVKHGGGLKARLREEILSYLAISAYLYLCFGVLLLYKAGALNQEGIHYLPFGVAAVKALVLGKFLLIGDALGAGTRVKTRTLAMRIASRVGMLLVVLVVLTLLEEIGVGAWHGRSIGATLAELGGSARLETLASIVVLLLVLLPLVATQEVHRALGPGRLRQLLFQPPADAADGTSSSRRH